MLQTIKSKIFFAILGLTCITSGGVFAIDLPFDVHPAVIDAFPCMEMCRYDARFNMTGNDFDGVLFRSGAKEITTQDTLPSRFGSMTVTGVVLEIASDRSKCPLDTCKYDTIVCKRQIQGLRYDKQRGERLLPVDADALEILQNLETTADMSLIDPDTGLSYPPIVGYTDMDLTGGWYTDCTGLYDPIKRYTPEVTSKHIYGQVRWNQYDNITTDLERERDGALDAGLWYDYDANDIIPDQYTFKNNLLFLNTRGDYLCYTGDLQGIGFDTAGGIFTFGQLASCIFPGDGFAIPHGTRASGFRHNDKPRLEPVRDSTRLRCYNGEFIEGNSGYRYSQPLNCTLPGDVTPIIHGQTISGYAKQYIPFALGWTRDEYFTGVEANNYTGYGYENVFCRDGALSGDHRYIYGTATILPPADCTISGTNQTIIHGQEFTGYKVLIANSSRAGDCQSGAVFSCYNGTMQVDTVFGREAIVTTCTTTRSTCEAACASDATCLTNCRNTYDLCITPYQTARNNIIQTFLVGSSYIYPTCTVLGPKSCALPRGGELTDGSAGYAYLKSEVLQGIETCTGQVLSCTNGILSGSYTKPSCQAIQIDRTPNQINCAILDNSPEQQIVSFPAYTITGMTAGYTGLITLGSGILVLNTGQTLTGGLGAVLLKNNIEIGLIGEVRNGDIISLKMRAATGYKVTRSLGIQIGGMQTLCATTTAPAVNQTVFTDPIAGITLDKEMQFGIRQKYMRLLSHYQDSANNMCRITESLQTIIGRVLFQINKNLLTTSNDQTRRQDYFRKLVLEYLLEITRVYRSKVVIEITKNSGGIPITYEEVGCTKWQQ